MKNFFRTVCFLIFFCLILTACSSKDQPVKCFEGGKLFKSSSGSFYIAELHGTFHQMGRQYGGLLKKQLKEFYQESVTDFLVRELGVKQEDLILYGRSYYGNLPRNFKDYIDGISETNGLDKDRTCIMSAALLLIFGSGCSSLSAWGDYTPDHYVVTGRNLDLPSASLRRFSKYFHLVVWNPAGYPASVASIDFLGGLFYQTAINSRGIFLALHNGQNADPSVTTGRENTNNILLESLFQNTSSTEVNQWFQSTLPQVGLIMNVSFPDHTTIYEWATFRVVARNTAGLIAATNDFTDRSWNSYPIVFFNKTNEGIAYTVTRRTQLMNLGQLNKGQINPQKMMDIFDRTIANGGPTFPEGGRIKTIYSVVVQPAELKMWLKVRQYSGWEEIDLKKYFKN